MGDDSKIDKLYIYIMYSSKIDAYKIGESRNVSRRLKEIQRGSSHGDSSVVLIDKFEVDNKLLIHRKKNNVDSLFYPTHNKQHHFKDNKWSEWFDISEDEARRAIIFGFKTLKAESEYFRSSRLKKRVNKRINYAISIAIHKKRRHSEIISLLEFINKCIKRCSELSIPIETKIDYIRVLTVYNRLYIDNKALFDIFITRDMFLKGVLLTAKMYKSKLYFKAPSKLDIFYIKEYHALIMRDISYIKSKIKSVELINDRYSSRKAILPLSSRLAWESSQFADAVRENSHLLSLEHYYSYNDRKHNDDLYFLSLVHRFKDFRISGCR